MQSVHVYVIEHCSGYYRGTHKTVEKEDDVLPILCAVFDVVLTVASNSIY